MKKNYICPTVECKALMAESLMHKITDGEIQMSAHDLNTDQVFTGGYSIGVNNGATGGVPQDAKGGLSDWDDL